MQTLLQMQTKIKVGPASRPTPKVFTGLCHFTAVWPLQFISVTRQAFMRRSLLVALALTTVAPAQAAEINAAASKLTVRVYKTGFFSGFAHDHTISAPIASGRLDAEKLSVELKVHTADMKVMDPGSKDSEKAQIESTMKSDKVLDVTRFPEISFVSSRVETSSPGHFLVHGSLTLHGATKPIEFPVEFSDGKYSGSVKLKQTDFGITPVKVAGGTVRVKDEIDILFEIVPAQ